MPSSPIENRNTWESDRSYGEMLYRRAIGDLPEMESSKAVARRIKKLWRPGDSILDVGCGAGHYLVSLRREIGASFEYVGVDSTANYIDLARNAFDRETSVRFEQADIFNLPFESGSFGIVMCSNVFPCLPNIVKPLSELMRVARDIVVVRLLCGDRTHLIREVRAHEPELDASGEPYSFAYLNIYSRKYVESLLKQDMAMTSFSIEPDLDFVPENITKPPRGDQSPPIGTTTIGNMQVNGYILMPWAFLTISKRC